MPFKVPANSSPDDRTRAYDLFGIGKQDEKLWIRKIKAFFTFGWNTAKLTDDYIQDTLLSGRNRDKAILALGANPKWLTRTKDLTVTTAIYARIRNLGDSDRSSFVDHLERNVKVDGIFKMIHGKKELAAEALATFELKGDENKAKLQAILDKALRKADFDLIGALAKTHKDLNWKGALDTIAKSRLLAAAKMQIVETILSHVDIKTLFNDGKVLAEWLENKDTVIRLVFIPHIGVLRDAFVEALGPLALRTYAPNALPSYILTEDRKEKIDAMETGKLKLLVNDILGVKYVIKHWDQLDDAGKKQYLAGQLLIKANTGGLDGLNAYFEGAWLADEIAKLPKSE